MSSPDKAGIWNIFSHLLCLNFGQVCTNPAAMPITSLYVSQNHQRLLFTKYTSHPIAPSKDQHHHNYAQLFLEILYVLASSCLSQSTCHICTLHHHVFKTPWTLTLLFYMQIFPESHVIELWGKSARISMSGDLSQSLFVEYYGTNHSGVIFFVCPSAA